MRTKLIKIGNSRGVRLPKAIIEQAGLRENNVELLVDDGQVVLRSPPRRRKKNPRAGWEEQIKKALAEHGDDIDEWRHWQAMSNEFDDKEWTW